MAEPHMHCAHHFPGVDFTAVPRLDRLVNRGQTLDVGLSEAMVRFFHEILIEIEIDKVLCLKLKEKRFCRPSGFIGRIFSACSQCVRELWF